MSLNNKAILPDDSALDPSFALRPSAPMPENGNGEWTSSAPPAAAETAPGAQLATYFHALRRHWVLATALGLLLAPIAGLSVWLGMGARYTADAYLKCAYRDDEVLRRANAGFPSEIEFEVFKNTQLSMILNRLVLNSAVQKKEKVKEKEIMIAKIPLLAEEYDPADLLMRKLSISFPRKDEIMKVSMTTKDPNDSAAIVQAVVNSYIDEVVEAERDKRDKRISELKGIQVTKTDEVKTALGDLRRMADSLGTSDTDALNIKQKNTLDELANLRSEFIRNQFELNRITGELASLKAIQEAAKTQPITDIEVQITCVADPILRDLGADLVYEKQQEQYMVRAISKTSKKASVKEMQGSVGRIQQQYNKRLDELREELTKKKISEVERDVQKFEAHIAILKKQNEIAQEELKQLRKDADRFGMSSIDMQMRRKSIENATKSLDTITAELETLSVEAKKAPRVSKIQDVVEPPKNEATFWIRVALSSVVSVLGFCLPFLGVVAWDLKSNRINGTEDVADRLGLPVIGSVPRIPSRILHYQGMPKKGHQNWQLRLTESVDGISARLLRQAETEQRRVIMVTSAVNGEGKTTLTAQLAMSLARAGRRTLLVDFDLRQPTFDEVFGLPKAPGLSEILRGESDLSACIHATGTENLSVLTAGCWDRFALAALANHSVASLFKELREDYEFVIVDTSPILPIADTRFVSQYVDSVVLCIFRDISQAPRIRAACEILEAFGVRAVEAVVTGVNDNLGGKCLSYYQHVEPANSAPQGGEIAEAGVN
jgi:polysaccharide biosynthesis transport protein